MKVLSESQRRVLQFVEAANHGGCSPTPDEVTEWVESPNLKRGKVTRRTVKTPGIKMPDAFNLGLAGRAVFADIAKTMEETNRRTMASLRPAWSELAPFANAWESERVVEEREPDETLIEQVQRFQWVRSSSTGAGLLLTDLGRALLRSDADQSAASDVTVLDGQDPLAWGSLVGTIAEIGECLIVDPYLKPEQFLDIAKFTGTTRVILRRPKGEGDLVRWRIHQALPGVSVDIRIIDPEHIHDRYIVGETAVYSIGCSLAGVGRKPTTLVPMTGRVADQIRRIVEEWWEAAEPVGEPLPSESSSDSTSGVAGDSQEMRGQIGTPEPKRNNRRIRKPKSGQADGEAENGAGAGNQE